MMARLGAVLLVLAGLAILHGCQAQKYNKDDDLVEENTATFAITLKGPDGARLSFAGDAVEGSLELSGLALRVTNIPLSKLADAEDTEESTGFYDGPQTLGATLRRKWKFDTSKGQFGGDTELEASFQYLEALLGNTSSIRKQFESGFSQEGMAESLLHRKTRRAADEEVQAHEGDGIPVPKIKLLANIQVSGLPPFEQGLRDIKEPQEKSYTSKNLPNLRAALRIKFSPDDNLEALGIRAFELNFMEWTIQEMQIGWVPRLFPRFHIWKKLKVQPWGLRASSRKICLRMLCLPQLPFLPRRILSPACRQVCVRWIWLPDLDPTGPAGLAFGRPKADELWSQAGVQLEWAPLKYINRPDLKVLGTIPAGSSEYDELMDMGANNDDYVDIYFAREFSPDFTAKGGGATRASGSANARITTTEKMVDIGVDITHLAHELGHAVNLGHPGNAGSLSDASTGTLMCPSGYGKDNPRVQSRENADLAASPLFTFLIKFSAPPAPSCDDSADCGACCKVCPGSDVCTDC